MADRNPDFRPTPVDEVSQIRVLKRPEVRQSRQHILALVFGLILVVGLFLVVYARYL